MEITTTIKYKSEKIEVATVLDEENITPYYVFVENNHVKDYLEELEISNDFKKALNEVDIIKYTRESIPYAKYATNGLFFEFDLKEFKKSLQEHNLHHEWRKLEEWYDSDVAILEQSIYGENSILREYNRLMEESL